MTGLLFTFSFSVYEGKGFSSFFHSWQLWEIAFSCSETCQEHGRSPWHKTVPNFYNRLVRKRKISPRIEPATSAPLCHLSHHSWWSYISLLQVFQGSWVRRDRRTYNSSTLNKYFPAKVKSIKNLEQGFLSFDFLRQVQFLNPVVADLLVMRKKVRPIDDPMNGAWAL